MTATFSDRATFCDGAGFQLWTPPKIALVTRRPRVLEFAALSLPPAKIRLHPHAKAYSFGSSGLFASIVPYFGNASVALVDMDARNVFVTGWSPAKGFCHDPTDWLSAKDRGRLWCGSPGHTILELAELLVDLVRSRIDAVPGEIAAEEYAERRWQYLDTAFWEED